MRQLSFTDYDGFCEKFKPKKTTDECYTPPAVYEAVLEYVNRNVAPLEGREVVRPFWPGGDYERHEYPPGCIVIDNPPFSITSQIVRFYIRHGIDFFLFCDGLTCMNLSNVPQLAFHIINKSVTFENGANVAIAFVTNVRPNGERIVLAGELEAALRVACKQPNKENKKTRLPARGRQRRASQKIYKPWPQHHHLRKTVRTHCQTRGSIRRRFHGDNRGLTRVGAGAGAGAADRTQTYVARVPRDAPPPQRIRTAIPYRPVTD